MISASTSQVHMKVREKEKKNKRKMKEYADKHFAANELKIDC